MNFPRNNISRRLLLKAGMAGAGGLAMGGPLARSNADAADKAPGDGFVDAHSHIWTRDIKKFPLAQGQTLADLDPPSFTDEELLRTARAKGVDRVVLIQHGLYHGFDNSYCIDAARRCPGVFSIVARVDESRPDVAEQMRKLARQRVRGFRIRSWDRSGKWLDGPEMASMWKCGAERNLAICPLMNPDALANLDRMCAKYPDTPVVVDHLARIGADGEIRQQDVGGLCRLARHKRTHVKVSAFYALGKKQPPYLDLAGLIRQVLDAFGPERLMWASDSPYQVVKGHTYAASIALVRDRLDFLSPDDRQWLLQKTAQRVFFA